ncbi:MAG: CRISPR-associated protein Cas4 [Candidatus Freyarchaeota archaeon]
MNVYFTAEDVRQYAYCKRKIYFRYVLRARVKPTVKMERGREEHEKLEWRRKKRGGGGKYFSVYLSSERLGLAGVVDYFDYGGGEVVPVEVKFGGGERIYADHYLQLVAEALLLEDCFGVRVEKGIIEYPDKGIRREVKITDGARLKVLKILDDIRRIVRDEVPPSSGWSQAKCEACEVYRVCRQV